MVNKKIEEVLNGLEGNARKLATLIFYSTMPDDVKEAWIALLPEMTLEQMEKLLNILESKYIDEKTRPVDEEYKAKLESLIKELEAQKESEDKKTVELLKKISDKLS
jgi:antitoxin component of RelBE/YafQ-DinJ toxin-antitoxin module